MKKYFIFFVLFIGGTMSAKETEKAIFAGGCFWCMESDFEKVKGVEDIISGYIGGTQPNPTYKDYGSKRYIEAIEVSYDPKIVSYDTLLDFFWRHIDPTDPDGQFVDRGKQYRSGIFYLNESQKKRAQTIKAKTR